MPVPFPRAGEEKLGPPDAAEARNERCRELTAGDDAHHEGAQTKITMHVQREHRQRQADDQEAHQDDRHQRQQDDCNRAIRA